MYQFISRIGTLSCLFVCLFLFPAQAQQKDSTGLDLKVRVLGTDDLKEVSERDAIKIVSASRSGKSIQELPFSAFVVTKEEILRNGYRSLTDVLKMVPGVRTMKSFSGSDGEGFMMRGLIGNQYAKILLNDMPLQPSVNGTLTIGEQLPIAQAERIEIIFGPSSAVYGADAMVGVINIITKEAENMVFAEADVSTGNNNYRHSNFLVGGKAGTDKDIVKYTIYGSFSKQDDQNIKYSDGSLYNVRNYTYKNFRVSPEIRDYLENNPEVLDHELRHNFPYYSGSIDSPDFGELPRESRMIGINLKYRNLRFSFNETYFKNYSSVGRDPVLFGYHDPSTFMGSTSRQVSLHYQKKFNQTLFTANASYLRYRMDNKSSLSTNYLNGKEGTAYFYNASDDLFFEVLLNRVLWTRLEATAGVSVNYSGVLPTLNELAEPFDEDLYSAFGTEKHILDPFLGDFGYHPHTFFNLGAFLQLFWSKNRWTLTGGFRADKPSEYEGDFYSRFAGLYRLNAKHNFRFSIGSGFKAPSPNNMYSSTAFRKAYLDEDFQAVLSDSIDYQQVPNPTLQPEVFEAFEIGYRFTPSRKWDFDFSVSTGHTDRVISGKIAVLDPKTYPLASSESRLAVSQIYLNDEDSEIFSYSLQASAHGRDLVPSIGLGLDFTATYTNGWETLPDKGGDINGLRMVPPFLLQARMNARFRTFYVNIESVYASPFYRRFIPNEQALERPENLLSGYFTTDVTVRKQISDQFGFYLQVGNLFDTKYGGIGPTGLDVDLLYNPQPGRTFRFGVSFRTL